MSILFGMLIVPLFGQNGLSFSIFEYPEPLVFSKDWHFKEGVGSSMTLLVSDSTGEDAEEDPNDFFNQWELSIIAEEDLSNGFHSIPVSSIWARVRGSARVRSTGKIFLSTKLQTIAKSKLPASYSDNSLLEVELKAFNGEHFLKPAGEYTTFIYFTLMMD